VIFRELDARGMSHPEPLERAVAILRELDEQSGLYMRIHKNPIPLIKLAQENRYQVLSREVAIGEWHILITPNRRVDLETQLRHV
jgi:hypothetical protein